jgi:hypothetical protein
MINNWKRCNCGYFTVIQSFLPFFPPSGLLTFTDRDRSFTDVATPVCVMEFLHSSAAHEKPLEYWNRLQLIYFAFSIQGPT